MTSGLRISGTNGPKTGLLRVAKNSSAAFFCASVYFSEGIAGMRSWEMAFPEIEQTNTAQQMLLIIMIPPRADVRSSLTQVSQDFSLRVTCVLPSTVEPINFSALNRFRFEAG